MKHLGVFFAAVLCISGNFFAACPTMDLSGDCKVNIVDFSQLADQWLTVYDDTELTAMAAQWLAAGVPGPDITWVYVNDPGGDFTGDGISEGGFNGWMSKYETTNAQYCVFLNAALATGDILVAGNLVNGKNGTNNGMDYIGVAYYDMAGARISYSGGVFTVVGGYENHPVNFVSWYGADAFSRYYGWRLPTIWEWQAVADWNGTYTYGCGTTIDSTRANYNNIVGTTSTVGTYAAYGYGMCDMAGNVWEWTDTGNFNNHYLRGGALNGNASSCRATWNTKVGPDWSCPYWDSGYKFNTIGFRVCRVTSIPAPDMTWTSISDYEFNGQQNGQQISKYETTNAQYCVFLNDAMTSGDITVSGEIVYGASGSNPGQDFVSQVYCNLDGPGGNADGIVNGGAARIHYSGGVFSVDSGFESHPVTYVSQRGAAAFCSYYGWRLPNLDAWKGVANFTGSWTYGCGTSINNSIANYLGSSHPFGTREAGALGTYGYGVCDMAGNVWEWTSSGNADGYYYKGGGWDSDAGSCNVSLLAQLDQYTMTYNLGFRASR
jgi:formylglycine-generating enzyme required for sulfatase activity